MKRDVFKRWLHIRTLSLLSFWIGVAFAITGLVLIPMHSLFILLVIPGVILTAIGVLGSVE